MLVWYKLDDGEASRAELNPGALVDDLKLKVIQLNGLTMDGRSLRIGSIKVYPAGTPVPVPKGNESLDPGDQVPAGTTSRMPLIVVVPAPPQQRESPGLHEHISLSVRGLDNRLSAISPEHKNPWMNVHVAEKAKTPRIKNMRQLAITHYNGDTAVRGRKRGLSAQCCVTGCRGFDREIDAAHILPHGSSEYWQTICEIRDLDDLRNIVLLCRNIEMAFDKLQLCFLKYKEEPGVYKLKVWDKKGLEDTILYNPHNRRDDGSVELEDRTLVVADNKSSQLITEYDGHEFRFLEGKHPFSRLLSYHAQTSYKLALDKQWITSNEACPKKFGSPFDDFHITCHNSVDPLQRGETSITSETSLSARQISFRDPSVEQSNSFFASNSNIHRGKAAVLVRKNLTMPLADLQLGFQLVSGASNVDGITKHDFYKLIVQDASLGNIYKRVKELMDRRAILCESDGFEMKHQGGGSDQPAPVQSPIIDVLINLYSQSQPAPQGVIYVMYAPAGQGKTFGARSFLEHFYAFPGEGDTCVKGFMLTCQALDIDYMSQLSAHLGATAVNGWIHALLLAMDEPDNLEPSLLILDGFNSLGEDNVNEIFIQQLYGLMNARKNMIVVVSTQEETVANKLCSLNGGQRIAPLSGTYTGKETLPTWNGMNWSRDLLIEAVRYEFPGKFPQNHEFDFIASGMTPLQAKKATLLSLRTGRVGPPGSPNKKKPT